MCEIKSFDPRNASDAELALLNDLQNQIRAERLPDDPPIPRDEAIRGARHIPPFVNVSAWAVWNQDASQMIANASCVFLNTPENKHMVEAGIEVQPEFRRHGWARKLLAEIARVMERESRPLMLANTNERIPAGAALMERLGGERGLEMHTNQLKIAELNRALIREWLARADERATGFELGLWTGAYPEADLEAIALLLRVMNTSPRGTLQIEDFNFTPDQLRQQEKSMFERGTERWTLYVRERATGKFAGFTEVFWNPNRPAILSQGGTGVFPEFRNLSLGRWLKAAMLEKILRERSQVQFIRTGNADSNAAMLKINHELGFKPYMSQIVWQVQLARVKEYLRD
ncbi:MAG: GNAT family N-acetyltransferase [Chloroflexi bacterium]|nr:GNAT family N-acetyltransferase [Chloroflexota bacterium]